MPKPAVGLIGSIQPAGIILEAIIEEVEQLMTDAKQAVIYKPQFEQVLASQT